MKQNIIPARFRAVFLTAALIAASSTVFAGSPAWLVQASGHVEVTGPSGMVAAKPPVLLAEGATVKTGSDGLALVVTADGSKIQVRSGSSFTFATASTSETTFSLLMGAITCWVRPQSGRHFNVRVPGAVAAVRGTIFVINVGDDGNSTFDLHEGAMDVNDSFGRSTSLVANQRVECNVVRGLTGAPSPLPPNNSAPAEPEAAVPPAAEIPAAPAPQEPPASSTTPSDESSTPPPPSTTPEQGNTVSPVSPSAP